MPFSKILLQNEHKHPQLELELCLLMMIIIAVYHCHLNNISDNITILVAFHLIRNSNKDNINDISSRLISH